MGWWKDEVVPHIVEVTSEAAKWGSSGAGRARGCAAECSRSDSAAG